MLYGSGWIWMDLDESGMDLGGIWMDLGWPEQDPLKKLFSLRNEGSIVPRVSLYRIRSSDVPVPLVPGSACFEVPVPMNPLVSFDSEVPLFRC